MDKMKKAKKTIPDTICRVHRSGGYAVLSNCFVRSTNIGCDSIGLLGKINDLPPSWNFTIAGLVAICEDGETAIKSQLAELEQWGYVKKTLLMPNESPTGRISYLYDFYEYSELDDSIPKYDIEMETFTADNATLNRVKKDSNFTIISAKLIRSNKIRNKLIGFMMKVLSLPNSWNFSTTLRSTAFPRTVIQSKMLKANIYMVESVIEKMALIDDIKDFRRYFISSLYNEVLTYHFNEGCESRNIDEQIRRGFGYGVAV